MVWTLFTVRFTFLRRRWNRREYSSTLSSALCLMVESSYYHLFCLLSGVNFSRKRSLKSVPTLFPENPTIRFWAVGAIAAVAHAAAASFIYPVTIANCLASWTH